MPLLQSMADVRDPRSLSNRMRTKRFRRFARLFDALPRPVRIVDLGGTPSFWEQRGWAGRAGVEITTVNIDPEPSGHPGVRSVRGDVCDLADLPDGAFDVAFSNSVIEHLETLDRQRAMARTIRRLAPAYWVQTPNFWFPMEPHFHVLGWQFMPVGLRKALLRHHQCGWRGPCPDDRSADAAVREVRLMTRSELAGLFPDGTVVAERFGGLVKSWIVHGGFPAPVATASDLPESPAANTTP